MFYFRRPIKANYEIEDKGYYKACKDLKRFYEAGGLEAGHDTDYFYYEIKRREKYEVGDKIRFKNKDFYVNQYSAYALKNEVIYKYRLCRKNGIWQTKMYNSLLSGGSLEGKVLDVEGEKVKLNLDIDKGQSKEVAWFPYAPPTGNTMYSMPIVGTSASLYFPNESSEAPIVTGCVRKNGSSCAKTSDTTKRYFGTEHGSEIEMTPGALNISGGSKEPLNISFDDNTGVTLKSPKKLSLNADGEILIKTPQNISIKAESQILVAKAGTQSGFSIENEFHFSGDSVIKDGSDRETYDPFNDEPKEGKRPEEKKEKKEEKKKEKKGFSWGKLAIGVLAAVAAGTAAVAFTAGTAIPAVAGTLAAIGTTAAAVAKASFVTGMVMGLMGVADKAGSDIANKEVSDVDEYAVKAAKDTFAGAVCGALFAPFMIPAAGTGLLGEIPTALQRTGTLLKTMYIGGTFNYTYYDLRERTDGRIPSIQQGLEEFKVGALFSGFMYTAVTAISEISPFIKNASKNNIKSGTKGGSKAEAIREDMLNNGAKWKSDKALDKHVAKRIKKGHIPDDWTAEEYNNKINEIMEKDNLEVYEYTKNEKTGEPFDQKYYIYGDGEWVVMVGENGAMETAFPPDTINGGYSGYLESLKVDRIK